ncbi:MAG: glycosyltransferase family 2 protein [Candidatus Omnitrophica bacterium]|nr:glycosyltransferase family 2 protein [Candidatus Omnitrophota bacterium]
MKKPSPLVSIVMPCLNEEETLGICIERSKAVLKDNAIDGEIIVCDNGSTDRSVEIARSLGAKVVHEPEKGYGNAYLKGFSEARGEYFVMIDADNTYDFSQIPVFIEKLEKECYDFVTGKRILNSPGTGAMSSSHFFGNKILTFLLNIFFGTNYTDVYCGFRAFSRGAYDRIKPVSEGMEFNLEIAINAAKDHLRIIEIPTSLSPRKGQSKLRTFYDGWRSLRLMILYAPNKTFVLPGSLAGITGLILHALSMAGVFNKPVSSGNSISGIAGMILSILGLHILSLGLYTKTYSLSRKFERKNQFLVNFYSTFKLEHGMTLGSLLLAGGIISFLLLIPRLSAMNFESVLPGMLFSSTIIISGVTIIFSSLFISAMSLGGNQIVKKGT